MCSYIGIIYIIASFALFAAFVMAIIIDWVEKRKTTNIVWIDFNDKKPNYGDLIILRFPPEARMIPVITIYDRDTMWLDGDVYAIIEHSLK